MKLKRHPVGVDDFKEIIDEKLFYVDKTLFIKEIIDDGSKVVLITRPRRFGKTLNMSLLRYYFEKSQEDKSYLFIDLKIWQQGEEYTKEHNKYPVIDLTFKSVKSNNWEVNFDLIKTIISTEYVRHSYLQKSDAIIETDKNEFNKIINKQGNIGDYINSVELLSRLLYLHFKEKPIVLLDEYDTLLNDAYIYGYWEEAIAFMRGFMSAGFKNNKYMFKGVMTAIFRIAKESIFSEMNNLKVCTVLNDGYRECFGFTQGEVEEILKYYGIEERMDNVAQWYNGYIFGGKNQSIIYNPWSIIKYSDEKSLKPYWINTSGNEIIKKLATEGGPKIQYSIQDLIEGKTIDRVKINENITYADIDDSEDSVWSFLLMGGYMKSIKTELKDGQIYCNLKLPNQEVFFYFRKIYDSWFKETIKVNHDQMLKALLTGDVKTFYKYFATAVESVVSYFDVGEDKSENFYHAFVLGILVYLEKDYEVRSNRESGFGRYDVMIIPKDRRKKGIIIEFKKVDKFENETIETALEAALKQIEDKRYDTELTSLGINDIVKVGIAFKGKEVKVGKI